MEFSLLVDAVGRAWRAEDLHSKQHSLTGDMRDLVAVRTSIDAI